MVTFFSPPRISVNCRLTNRTCSFSARAKTSSSADAPFFIWLTRTPFRMQLASAVGDGSSSLIGNKCASRGRPGCDRLALPPAPGGIGGYFGVDGGYLLPEHDFRWLEKTLLVSPRAQRWSEDRRFPEAPDIRRKTR